MSLKQAAQHLAAHGRGPDQTLVHMSPREVAGLQAIAKAHGGSLTINPSTGLAEAGFLDRIMPALIGAGLMAATGGAAAPAVMGMSMPTAIGVGIGGLTALQTGNIGKGIMAGLGAYGGAGLYGGAEAAGMFGGEEAAAQAAAPVSPSAPTAFNPATASTDMTAYAPTPTQFGAMGEAPVPGEFGQFGEAGVSDAAQRAASSSYGSAQLPMQTPTTPMPAGDTIKYGLAATAPAISTERGPIPGMEHYDGPLSRYRMSDDYKPYEAQQPNPYYEPKRYTYGMAEGGPVEQMSNANAVGMNTGYPQADITGHAYATPWQTPISQNVVSGTADTGVNRMNGQMLAEGGMAYAAGGDVQLQGRVTIDDHPQQGGQFGQDSGNGYQPMGSRGMMGGGFDPRAVAANPQGFQDFMQQAQQREQQYPGSTMLSQLASAGSGLGGMYFAEGGMAYAGGGQLGGYSDGGRMLKGPGDGMSDSIPAQIGSKQPARLADGEFVVPADVVSHLGNGSSDAGAKQLYKMMDRIRAARTGKKKQAPQVNPGKAMPA